MHVGTKPNVPEKISASRPELKKDFVQRAETEAMTCFGGQTGRLHEKNAGELFKITVTISRIPE